MILFICLHPVTCGDVGFFDKSGVDPDNHKRRGRPFVNLLAEIPSQNSLIELKIGGCPLCPPPLPQVHP